MCSHYYLPITLSYFFLPVIYIVLSVVITVVFMCVRENYGRLGSDRGPTKGREAKELLEDSDDSTTSTD